MKWRRTLRTLHRDIGYFCVGLTVIYAVSGVAVNHRNDWDYNFAHSQETHALGAPAELIGLDAATVGETSPAQLAREHQKALVASILAALGRETPPRNIFWRGADRLSLFFAKGERDVVDYHPSTGIAVHSARTPRVLIREVNYLHLNEGRGAWTWIADAFAVALLFLALSGALILRGRKGLIGRGGILLALGIVLPIVALLLLRT